MPGPRPGGRVTGGLSFGQFTVVGCFVSPRLVGVSAAAHEKR